MFFPGRWLAHHGDLGFAEGEPSPGESGERSRPRRRGARTTTSGSRSR